MVLLLLLTACESTEVETNSLSGVVQLPQEWEDRTSNGYTRTEGKIEVFRDYNVGGPRLKEWIKNDLHSVLTFLKKTKTQLSTWKEYEDGFNLCRNQNSKEEERALSTDRDAQRRAESISKIPTGDLYEQLLSTQQTLPCIYEKQKCEDFFNAT